MKKANGQAAIQNYQKKAKHPDVKKMIDIALQNLRTLPGNHYHFFYNLFIFVLG